jgi:hypothetical protein
MVSKVEYSGIPSNESFLCDLSCNKVSLGFPFGLPGNQNKSIWGTSGGSDFFCFWKTRALTLNLGLLDNRPRPSSHLQVVLTIDS